MVIKRKTRNKRSVQPRTFLIYNIYSLMNFILTYNIEFNFISQKLGVNNIKDEDISTQILE